MLTRIRNGYAAKRTPSIYWRAPLAKDRLGQKKSEVNHAFFPKTTSMKIYSSPIDCVPSGLCLRLLWTRLGRRWHDAFDPHVGDQVPVVFIVMSIIQDQQAHAGDLGLPAVLLGDGDDLHPRSIG